MRKGVVRDEILIEDGFWVIGWGFVGYFKRLEFKFENKEEIEGFYGEGRFIVLFSLGW